MSWHSFLTALGSRQQPTGSWTHQDFAWPWQSNTPSAFLKVRKGSRPQVGGAKSFSHVHRCVKSLIMKPLCLELCHMLTAEQLDRMTHTCTDQLDRRVMAASKPDEAQLRRVCTAGEMSDAAEVLDAVMERLDRVEQGKTMARGVLGCHILEEWQCPTCRRTACRRELCQHIFTASAEGLLEQGTAMQQGHEGDQAPVMVRALAGTLKTCHVGQGNRNRTCSCRLQLRWQPEMSELSARIPGQSCWLNVRSVRSQALRSGIQNEPDIGFSVAAMPTGCGPA